MSEFEFDFYHGFSFFSHLILLLFDFFLFFFLLLEQGVAQIFNIIILEYFGPQINI